MKSDIKIEYIDIDLLKPAEYNPRKATEKQWGDLRASLKKFGFVDPVIVNKHKGRENTIIGGHFRVKVAKKIGIKEVPVVYVNLDSEAEKELNLRLNKNSGDWDWGLLANLDDKLLRDVGFEDREMKKLFQGEEVEGDQEFTTELLEENNYLVFTFDNVMDWNFIVENLGIKTIKALDSKKGYERKGIGRVLSGKKLIEIINENNNS